MNTINTKELRLRKEELEEEVLDSFLENFPQYEDMTPTFNDILFEEEEIQSWKGDYLDHIDEICQIEKMEDIMGAAFVNGTNLIDEYDFEEHTREFVEEVYEIRIPFFVEIDWDKTANNLKADYRPIEYQGCTYYYY